MRTGSRAGKIRERYFCWPLTFISASIPREKYSRATNHNFHTRNMEFIPRDNKKRLGEPS